MLGRRGAEDFGRGSVVLGVVGVGFGNKHGGKDSSWSVLSRDGKGSRFDRRQGDDVLVDAVLLQWDLHPSLQEVCGRGNHTLNPTGRPEKRPSVRRHEKTTAGSRHF